MSKPWKCRLGWHEFVRQSGQDDPNSQVCLRCGKKRSFNPGTLGGMG